MTDDFYIPPVKNEPKLEQPEKNSQKPKNGLWYFCAGMAVLQFLYYASTTSLMAREVTYPGCFAGAAIGVIACWWIVYWMFNR